MTNAYDEAAGLFPSLAKYKKLAVSLLGTTSAFVIFLVSGDHTTAEIVGAAFGYVLTNFGVERATNAP